MHPTKQWPEHLNEQTNTIPEHKFPTNTRNTDDDQKVTIIKVLVIPIFWLICYFFAAEWTSYERLLLNCDEHKITRPIAKKYPTKKQNTDEA